MTIAVFGATGQVARELDRHADVRTLGRDVVDFRDPNVVAEAARGVLCDAIVNAVAYTAVDAAESDEETARLVNATSVAALAGVAAERGLPLVHISTDYVFDGSGNTPWMPDMATAPLGVYGRTKLAGEDAVRSAAGPHAVLRTSWVFSAHGRNFATTMLRLGAERPVVNVVADQVGGPTPARAIADACVRIAKHLVGDPSASGAYHFSGAPDVSWADFARAIFAEAGLPARVNDIPTEDYPTPAARPRNSRLDCTATEAVFGIARPDWREGLRAAIAECSSS